jgi:flagellar hook-associated protein 2
VANSINGDNLGVTASVVTDATGARLAIVANTSGSAANFSVTSPQLASFGFTQSAGVNASLTVDGIAIQSATNTVTNAVPGLTLNLLSAVPGTQVSLGVSPDTSQASTAINQFVTDYNAIITAVNAQFSDSGSGQGALATDPNMRNLQSELEGALSYTATNATGKISSLASYGVSVNSDGTLSVDSSALSSALQNNFSDVQNFFQGSALNGFANSLDQQLSNFTNPANGAFTIDLQSISTEYSTLQTDVTNFQNNVITPLKAQLQSEYSKAEIALQQLPTEMKQIQQELGYNSSNG